MGSNSDNFALLFDFLHVFSFFSTNAKSPESLDTQDFRDNLFGALQGIRTPDLLIRSQALYPTELAAQMLSSRTTI